MNAPTRNSEPKLTDDALDRIARILRDISGIEMGSEKKLLIQARLSKRLRETSSANFEEYCDVIEASGGSLERQEMLSALTTNVTQFFREYHHFEHLQNVALPKLFAQAIKRHPVRAWSAACSTGEEAYSIAMSIADTWPNFQDYNIKILATDIDPKVIRLARLASYPGDPLHSENLNTYRKFTTQNQNSNKISISSKISDLITFNTLNLNNTWPMTHNFDIIFCRNVTIYFDKENQKEIWAKLARSLNPGGYLYIGHSERIENFESLKLCASGATTYQKI